MVKVSVIIPAYNAERYVKEALESVMAQSLTEIEILAVDDGSTDRTGEILGFRIASLSHRIPIAFPLFPVLRG